MKLHLFAGLMVTLFAALPARATLVFEFHRPVNQSDITVGSTTTTATTEAAFLANSPLITSLNVLQGQEVIVTVVLRQLDNIGLDSFADVGSSLTSQRMSAYGFGFRSAPGVLIVKSPFAVTPAPTDNISTMNTGSAFIGEPVNNLSPTSDVNVIRDIAAIAGPGFFNVGGYYPLASFRLRGVTPGSGNLQIFDFGPAQFDDIGSGLTPNMDALIYSHVAGGIYNLPFTVAVPEPTSMTLVGLALAGVVWKRRRVAR